jgi:D-glycero-alpha-D-manno-heptose-7-phosphate kinase
MGMSVSHTVLGCHDAGVGDVPIPHQVVNAAAPTRICDIGGWTDTWFAEHGNVLNIGVSPCVEVQVNVHTRGSQLDRIVLNAENYGERYGFEPAAPPGRHPLLEATIAELGIPDDVSVEISIFSEAPAGASTGTSAAATVALIGALDFLTPGRMTPQEIAYTAHRIEVDRLGIQSGIQDQFCATLGGINYIQIVSYPQAAVTPLQVPDQVWWELDRRLALLFLGRAHLSSQVHDRVIATLADEGEGSSRLDDLRHAAEHARDALGAADVAAFGRAMTENTDAQAHLHPALISKEAQQVIDMARSYGAPGWKVNGAGGDGGSITILCSPDMRVKRELLGALCQLDPSFRVVPVSLSRAGLRVWQT